MTTITATPITVLAEETPPPTARRRRRRIRWGTWITLAVISLFGFAPVYWLLATSLTPSDQVFAFPPTLFPKEVTFAHYATVFGNEAIFVYFRNSVIVSVISKTRSALLRSIVSTTTASPRTVALNGSARCSSSTVRKAVACSDSP